MELLTTSKVLTLVCELMTYHVCLLFYGRAVLLTDTDRHSLPGAAGG